MEILGIGPLEFVFILLIALIVLGPKDMVKAGRTIGRALRTIVSSDTWRVVQQASREMRNLPNRLMREAGIEDLQKQFPDSRSIKEQLGIPEIEKTLKDANSDLSSWTTPPPTIHNPQKPVGEQKPASESAASEDESEPDTTPATTPSNGSASTPEPQEGQETQAE
jgi:sec-independent protein translocase protein TatB